MHLLPCPHCQTPFHVSPSQAGETVNCPACHAEVPIPKLGEIRQLPRAEESAARDRKVGGAASGGSLGSEGSLGRKITFGIAGIAATVSLLVASYCGIRWALVEVPSTTEDHIATVREELSKRTAAELIREYEDMDNRIIDLEAPFPYKRKAIEKAGWGRNASIAAALGSIALLVAVGCALGGRPKQP